MTEQHVRTTCILRIWHGKNTRSTGWRFWQNMSILSSFFYAGGVSYSYLSLSLIPILSIRLNYHIIISSPGMSKPSQSIHSCFHSTISDTSKFPLVYFMPYSIRPSRTTHPPLKHSPFCDFHFSFPLSYLMYNTQIRISSLASQYFDKTFLLSLMAQHSYNIFRPDTFSSTIPPFFYTTDPKYSKYFSIFIISWPSSLT